MTKDIKSSLFAYCSLFFLLSVYLVYECILYVDCTFLEERLDLIFSLHYCLRGALHYCNLVSIHANIETSDTIYTWLDQH